MSVLLNILIKFIGFLVVILPVRLQLYVGDALGVLWFDVIRLRRQIVLSNLKRAFPDMPENERIRIGRASVQNSGRGFVEFLRIQFLDMFDYTDTFEIIGQENLNKALEKKKGVCLLSLHLGNGDWGTVGLALHGVPLWIISKEFKWRAINDLWFRTRKSIGTNFIKDRGSSLQILKVLKKNGIIVFVLDQFMGPPIGVKTKFFGHETGTSMGLSIIVSRSGSPVLPCYTVRLPDGKTRIVIEEEIPFVPGANSDETIQNMTQTYCDHIEKIVRKYPEQWMWVHRRWKVFKH